jgi:hypothetical protein
MFSYKVPKNKFMELYSYTWQTTYMQHILAHLTTRLYEGNSKINLRLVGKKKRVVISPKHMLSSNK